MRVLHYFLGIHAGHALFGWGVWTAMKGRFKRHKKKPPRSVTVLGVTVDVHGRLPHAIAAVMVLSVVVLVLMKLRKRHRRRGSVPPMTDTVVEPPRVDPVGGAESEEEDEDAGPELITAEPGADESAEAESEPVDDRDEEKATSEPSSSS